MTRTLALAALMLVTGCSATLPMADVRSAETERGWQAAKATGVQIDCIESGLIRETQVRSDHVIDFRMRNGITYRNTLPNACTTLSINRSFSYRSDANQLCSIDLIRVNPPGGGVFGPNCRLGQFQPIDLPAG